MGLKPRRKPQATKDIRRVRLDVRVNGERLCVAGVPGYGVVSAHTAWVNRDPAWATESQHRDYDVPRELRIVVGGVDGTNVVDWHERSLQVGDTVTIQLLGPGPFDAPTKVWKTDADK